MRQLNKAIWRHRRRVKPSNARVQVASAPALGSFPKFVKKNTVINWKMFGDASPGQCLHDFYKSIYHLDDGTLLLEDGREERLIGNWLSLRIDLKIHRVTLSTSCRSRISINLFELPSN